MITFGGAIAHVVLFARAQYHRAAKARIPDVDAGDDIQEPAGPQAPLPHDHCTRLPARIREPFIKTVALHGLRPNIETRMDANRRWYFELMGGSVQFVIPVFQRDYNWEKEQCQQLWDDIDRVGRSEEGEHFFGPTVYVPTAGHGAAFTRWLLIDGQQRMTTISLLVTAMRDSLRESPTEDGTRAEKLQHEYLLNTFRTESERRKLILRDRDDETLAWLVNGGAEPPPEHRSRTVEQTYQFFRERLEAADLDVVEKGVGRLVAVDVRLDLGVDDPQQIFESLNSTGLDLTQADRIRNYVLMGLEEANQTQLYRSYWQPIERLFAGSPGQLDNFLRDFVALDTRAQKQGRADQVYASFRMAFGESSRDPDDLEELLGRMRRYAHYHAAFVMGTGRFPELADRLNRVRALATTPAILVMCLLDSLESTFATVDEVQGALDLIESYLVRRDVCGLQTRSYWQQFSRLAYALDRQDILGSLKAHLHWLAGANYAFPSNREFRHALEEEELYGRQICRTLLERLENGHSRERTDTSSLTIEHIMPQNEDLDPDWQAMLGTNWRDVHETWLQRLGNLTLTAYNEKYGDKPFEVKKQVPDGFNESPLRLNRFIREQDQWTAREMEARGVLLAKQALTIWSALEVSEPELQRAKVRRLRSQQGDVQASRRGMDSTARDIFDRLRQRMLKAEGALEVARPKSVSYHNARAELVCEILPRTHRLLVLLGTAVGEAAACDLEVQSAGDYKFLPHAQYDAESLVNLYSLEDVVACEPLLRQALAVAMD